MSTPSRLGPSPRRASRLRAWAPGWAAAALAAIVYAGTLRHGFVYDDAFLLRSPMLAHPWNLRELFSGGFFGPEDSYIGLYRPLGQWTLVLNAVLTRELAGSQDSPMLFHAANVLLHALASFLVFAWLVRLPLGRFVAGATAILWAVHPVHAEVAANVTARYESLAAVFGLSFLIAYRSRKGALAALLLLAALGCKESAVALLPLALAAEMLFPVGDRRFSARAALPAVAALALWFLLRAHALAGKASASPVVENVTWDAPFFARALTAGKVQVLYLRDQFLPLWLSSDHSFAEIELVDDLLDPFVLGFAVLLAASVVAAWLLRRREPAVALAVLGWAILFAPASNFLLAIGTIMADRLAYLPSVFACLLAALLLSKLRSPWFSAAAVAGLAGTLAALSFAEAREWKDDLTLFREQVRTAPRSAKSHANLGYALQKDDLLREAVQEYRKSIAIQRFRPDLYSQLAQCYELLGEQPELRIEAWSDSIRNWRRADRPTRDRILSLVDLGRWDELRSVREELAAADPRLPVLTRLDRILDAAEELRSTPAGGAHLSRAGELFRGGDWFGAEYEYRRALHEGAVPEKELRETLRNLGACHERLGRPDRARDFFALAAAVEGPP